MAKNYRIAGQQAPLANTDTTLYTVPASTQFVGSTLTICNRDVSVVSSYRVMVVPSGDILGNKHYIAYDVLISGRGTDKLTIGIALASGDKVYVRSDTANLSFTLFGAELT
jgi:hypothetical protein